MHQLPSNHWKFCEDSTFKEARAIIHERISNDCAEDIATLSDEETRTFLEHFKPSNVRTAIDGGEMQHEARGNIRFALHGYCRLMPNNLKEPFNVPAKEINVNFDEDVEAQLFNILTLEQRIAVTTFAYAFRYDGLLFWQKKAEKLRDVSMQKTIRRRIKLLPKFYNHRIEQICGFSEEEQTETTS